MRIAVVSPHLPTPAMPMRGLSHDEQIQGFVDEGHEVRGIVPIAWSLRGWISGARVPDLESDGRVSVVHPRYPRLPRILRRGSLERRLFSRAATTALAEARGTPDVILAQSASLPGGLVGRAAGIFVVALYDHELYDWAPNNPASRRALAHTLRAADCAVYVSDALRQQGTDVAGTHRSVVIPIGIKTYPDLIPVRPDHFRVCTVARLVARKRVDLLLRAFAEVRSLHPGARLVIVGDGPERPALEGLARELGIAQGVEFTGAVDARAAREQLARSSVMALPSVRESLAAVYFEAMSLGVPVLGTRGEGIEEHIEDGMSGILVPPGDPEALAANLCALAANPTRAWDIGDTGRRRFLAGPFTWRANALAYLALFAELSKARATHTT